MAIKRRDFLKGGAVAAGAFTLGFVLPGRPHAMEAEADTGTFSPNAFIRITPDNQVTVILGKSEMGQNVFTVLPMIVAEELDADWPSLRVEQSGVDAAFNAPFAPLMLTGGSTSVRTTYDALRLAGATARAMLVAAAAEAWSVPAEGLTTGNGQVRDPDSGRSASYGELASAAAQQRVPNDVVVKDPASFVLLGKDMKRLDSEAKVTGAATFGIDVRMPDMRYAAVARPPVIGATVTSFDSTRAEAMPGVVKVKQVPTGVAVIADSTWHALKARDALDISWNDQGNGSLDSGRLLEEYRKLAGQPGYVIQQQGDFQAIAAGAAQVIEATYEAPYLAHACMEPLNCTVQDHGASGGSRSADIWTGTQSQTSDRDKAAKVLGYEPEEVNLHTQFLGGGFGRRADAWSLFVVEAAHVAKGEPWPVKTTWTREDDMRGGQYRPLTVHRSRLALDKDGQPLAWENRVVSQPLDGMEQMMGPAENFDSSQVEGLKEQPYRVPAVNLEAHLVRRPVTTLWWRSVGHTHTAFLKETLFDEAAHAAGVDPLEYRLGLLSEHPRYVALLEKVRGMSGWGRKLPTGTGLGVAIEESFGSIVAEVAQVKVEGKDIRAEKVWCAIDCGFAVNPLGVREQMESAIVFGLTAALHGEITVKDGRVQQGNFDSYRMVRIDRAPAIEVAIIDSGAPIGGVGEPGTPPIFPAVGNAIFAASGQRLRSMPFRL